MKSFENSTKKLIIEKVRDIIIFEKDMIPQLEEKQYLKRRLRIQIGNKL